MTIRTIRATRYVVPLREGGSLPALVEADDDGMYVLKFRGAGQGPKALIAELVAGELARVAGLPVPEIVLVGLDPELARTEPDPEIQDLIRASAGLNLALEYLPGSVMFDPVVEQPDSDLASSVVWMDAYLSNVDRTGRNTNMLMWHRKLWLIDHGAALYFHHADEPFMKAVQSPFAMVSSHVLLRFAKSLAKADATLPAKLTQEAIRTVVEAIPSAWLSQDPQHGAASEQRQAYLDYLWARLQAPRRFAEEAIRAQALCV